MNAPRRPVPQALSAYEMMQRMEEQRLSEQRRSLRALDWSSGLIAVGTMALACVPKLGAITWFIGGPACLLVLVLSIISIAKGGMLSGLIGIAIGLLVMPLWCFMAPMVANEVSHHMAAQRALLDRAQENRGPSDLRKGNL